MIRPVNQKYYMTSHNETLNIKIQNETVSLMILLILSLSSFLDGFHVRWHFSVIGILLAISVVTISYVEEFMWIITIIAVILLVVSLFWNKYKKHSME